MLIYNHSTSNDKKEISMNEIREYFDKVNCALLLTASTFPGSNSEEIELKHNKWACDGKNISVEGYYQLEPVPKMLAKEGRIVDLIIVMASYKSKQEKSVRINAPGTNNPIYTATISPVDYFKQQINETKGLQDTQILIIDTEEESADGIRKRYIESISEAVNILRIIKEKNQKCRLYLDTHGGAREDQENLNAILSLLHTEGIIFDDIYNISGPNEPVKSISKTRIYDFATGVNEFINFGYSETLYNYIGKEENSRNREIAKLILEISDSLSLCNIDSFELSLDKLNKLIGNSVEFKPAKSYLEIFESTIKREYAEILDREKRNLINELEWANNKGFTQQCLAIVESKTPKHFMEKLVDKITIYTTQNDISQEITSDNYLQQEREPHEKFEHALISPISYASTHKKRVKMYIDKNYITIDALTGKSKAPYTYKFKYKLKINSPGKTEELIGIWVTLKQIRNMVMHANGTNPSKNDAPLLKKYVKRFSELDITGITTETILASDVKQLIEQYIECWKNI